MCVYIYIYIYSIYICVCMYVCMYVYIIKNQLTTSIFSKSPEIFNTNNVKFWAMGASTISG